MSDLTAVVSSSVKLQTIARVSLAFCQGRASDKMIAV